MAFIPTNGIARVAIKYSLYGQDVVNTLWFGREGIGGWNGTLLSDLNDVIITWCQNELLPWLSDELSLVSVTSTDQTSATANSIETIASGTGGITGVSMPGNCCLTVKFVTANRGRSGRGRNYISGVPTTVVTGNAVSLQFAEDVLAAYGVLISGLDFAPYSWVVVSHYTEHEPRTAGLVQAVVAPAIPDLNLDSQRRRLAGRGS